MRKNKLNIIAWINIAAFLIMQPASALPASLDKWKIQMHFIGIHIDAANYDDCLQKSVDLVRAGKDPNLVHDYCQYRYAFYGYCNPKKLTADDTKVLGLYFGPPTRFGVPIPSNERQGVNPRAKSFVIKNNTKLYLTNVTIIRKDSSNSHQDVQQIDVGHLVQGGTSWLDNNGYEGSANYSYYDSAEIVSAMGCLP